MRNAIPIEVTLRRIREPVRLVRHATTGALALYVDGEGADGGETVGVLPPLYPEWLGDRGFQEVHGVRFPYIAGAMANGIATPRLVVAMARAGMLGFFGAAGLSLGAVERGLDEIERTLGGKRMPWGANLIHSANEPELEAAVADLYVRRDVRTVEASAYMQLTPSVVRFAASGLHVAGGRIARRRFVIAKVSRPEIARLFMAPAPADLVREVVARGWLSQSEGDLAVRVPIATDVTVEADSGGHTDNRPLGATLPAILALRDELSATAGSDAEPLRVGAAGGLGTPAAVASAFALGAAYVLTGSVNQTAVEANLSAEAKRMLAQADLADVAMAAAADMFELGVKVQVLRRGTMFALRANRLYDVYRAHESLEEISPALRRELEDKVLGASFDSVWSQTAAFWRDRDPKELDRAQSDPKHRMALTFRWYLGKSSRWAIDGEDARRADFQMWCGPAMGAFNRWVKGSYLEDPLRRSVVQIALNLLEGAAVVTRAHQLRTFGVAVPSSAFDFRPRPLA